MSTVRVYKSTDPGAPPHPSALRGSMAALLRACLVVGYGSGEDAKAPAGWEEPFTESGNYAVFRALTGARQFFQIDDNQADADVTIMYGFESMSGVQTGAGKWGNRLFGKNSVVAGSSEWVVIADEKTCYVFLDTTRGLSAQCFGEYRSYKQDFPYNSLIAGHVNPAGLYTTTSTNSSGSSLVMGGAHGITDTISTANTYSYIPAHNHFLGVLTKAGVENLSFILNNGTYFSDLTCDYPVEEIYLITGGSTGLAGAYRGLAVPLGFRPKTHKEVFNFNGATFIALDIGYTTHLSGQGQVWVDITGSWGDN